MSDANREELDLLQRSAREWIADCAALGPDRGQGLEIERQWHRQIAEMGWFGVAVASEVGGAGLGWTGLGILLHELGRELVPTALIANSVLAEALKALRSGPLLSELIDGRVTVALAIDGGGRHDLGSLSTRAIRAADGWHLSGRKRYVPGGMGATHLLVLADAEGEEPALFIVEAQATQRDVVAMVDGGDWANVAFDALVLPASAKLPTDATAIERLLDIARIATAAQMLGASERALEISVEYLKLRRQFEQPIGAFQALQHRAARMCVEIELARSCVEAALAAADAGTAQLAPLASLAKAIGGETLHLVSNEIVQLHGGIGMTEDHVAGRYLKHARLVEARFGNAAWHADRYARLSGF